MIPAFLEETPLPDQAIEVACVLGAWGVHGAIKVRPYSSDPQALFSTKRWYLHRPVSAPTLGAPTLSNAKPLSGLLRIQGTREQASCLVATVADLTDRDQAESLKGAQIWILRSSFPTPEADEYYWVDLIGLSVYNRQGVCLGQVESLMPTGPQTVLVITHSSPSSQESKVQAQACLIPFVNAYVDRVDLPQKRIEVDWPLEWENAP